MKAVRLRTEYLYDPLGIDIEKPRLMWNCTDGITQSAYEIIITKGNESFSIGKTESSRMYHDLKEMELNARDHVTWKIRLWDENGTAGEWSEGADFEMGLLRQEDWKAKWISGNYKAKRTIEYPVDCFRKEFSLSDVAKARLYITSCGIYHVQINGREITDDVLTPGATDFNKRAQYQTYDVTRYLEKGNNNITVEVAGGWYKSYLISDASSAKGNINAKLLLQLEVFDREGNIIQICSDRSWLWSNDGPWTFANNKAGESVDASKKPSYSAYAKEVHFKTVLACSNNVPMRKNERFKGNLLITPSGKKVIDFSQNIAGFLSFDINASQGQKLTIYFGELLENGEFTQRNINPDKSLRSRFQKLEYVCKEGENHYCSRFAIYGFQYILIETDLDIQAEDFTAIAVYSDMESTYSFDSDNDLLNGFVKASEWSAKNNSADVPTDCPTRERVGWTGDAQIFVNSASYLFDYAAFGRKYIEDLKDAQYKNGSYTQCAPRCAMNRFMKVLDSSAGWADAGVLMPYRLWKKYNDDRFIADNYASMKKYGDYLIRKCGKKALNLKRPNIDRSLQKYLMMAGMSYGEWLEPTELVEFNIKEIGTPHVEESTAYAAYIFEILKEIAYYLGNKNDAERFKQYAKGCMKAYQALIKTPQYSLNTDRQAKLVRPLYMHLLNDEDTDYAQKRLIEALDHFKWRVVTGFLSTPFILPVLQNIDIEYAYKLLENEMIPGWLAMIKEGANTIWEKWEGTTEENPESLDHYSKGAVCEWIFAEMLGIHVEGNNHFLISPLPGGNFKRAGGSYQSIYGTVCCEWRIEDDTVHYSVTIPDNTTATVLIGNERYEIQAGKYDFDAVAGQ